jgi:hypothetical protein
VEQLDDQRPARWPGGTVARRVDDRESPLVHHRGQQTQGAGRQGHGLTLGVRVGMLDSLEIGRRHY